MDEGTRFPLDGNYAPPKTRGECLPGGSNEDRPCCQFACKYHLESVEKSCALDVADEGGATLEEVSAVIGVSRERIRQIEEKALRSLRKNGLKLRVYTEN